MVALRDKLGRAGTDIYGILKAGTVVAESSAVAGLTMSPQLACEHSPLSFLVAAPNPQPSVDHFRRF